MRVQRQCQGGIWFLGKKFKGYERKGVKVNTNPAGEKFLSPYKLDGPVPQFILDLYGW